VMHYLIRRLVSQNDDNRRTPGNGATLLPRTHWLTGRRWQFRMRRGWI